MKKSIIILLILISIFFTKASANGILCGNNNACNGGIQKAGDGIQQSGQALNISVQSVTPSITPITNSIGGFLHLFGF